MERRAFLFGGLVLLAAPLAAGAQRAEKIDRVGYLAGTAASSNPIYLAAFRQGMSDLGYVGGAARWGAQPGPECPRTLKSERRPEAPQHVLLVFRVPEITEVPAVGIKRHLIAQCLFEYLD